MRGLLICHSNSQALARLCIRPCTSFAQSRGVHDSYLPSGRGGRSSFSGVVATVFGPTGFIGLSVVNHLAAIGSSLVLPYRGTFERVQRHKLMSDLGQMHVREMFNSNASDDRVRELIEHSNVVVNLIGSTKPYRFYSMEEVNVTWPTRLAQLVAEKNDGTRLIHLSRLNCHSDEARKHSEILKQNFEAEQNLKEIYPGSTIVRCSSVHGKYDKFTTFWLSPRWVSLGMLGSQPLMYEGGESTIIQPVCVSDVAEGVARLARHPDAPGQTFEFVGPDRFTLNEFLEYVYNCLGRDYYPGNSLGSMDRKDSNILQQVVQTYMDYYFWKMDKPRIRPRFLDRLTRENSARGMWMTRDFFNMMQTTDRTTGAPGLLELGISPVAYEESGFDSLGVAQHENFLIRKRDNIIRKVNEESQPMPTVQHLIE
uniref:NADH dehydrogenase [ubiquinone] 1 alpha subcomplex subunit 9, mitochondrial isoform X2 n=1 Tax=Ciona intestinalis TaxID=7719 RepID=UPI00005232AA|nr:NADH dehydrogenase [ubiquinone] 1 alpha subcomplex subunit 9, mitochondrial isoform X2 [Ciona intestinalis]|eukprot:XP_002125647.1 NADH dehydrogenase [ubiquinone] 1 alpha subcomplex subunit 9, mitochondrial isoform X2 [Ciona intestinalis]